MFDLPTQNDADVEDNIAKPQYDLGLPGSRVRIWANNASIAADIKYFPCPRDEWKIWDQGSLFDCNEETSNPLMSPFPEDQLPEGFYMRWRHIHAGYADHIDYQIDSRQYYWSKSSIQPKCLRECFKFIIITRPEGLFRMAIMNVFSWYVYKKTVLPYRLSQILLYENIFSFNSGGLTLDEIEADSNMETPEYRTGVTQNYILNRKSYTDSLFKPTYYRS